MDIPEFIKILVGNPSLFISAILFYAMAIIYLTKNYVKKDVYDFHVRDMRIIREEYVSKEKLGDSIDKLESTLMNLEKNIERELNDLKILIMKLVKVEKN